MAISACLDHQHAHEQLHAHETLAAHQHDGGASDAPDTDGGAADLACQLQCQVQVQSRDQIKAFDLPAPVGQLIAALAPLRVAHAFPALRAERWDRYASAAPPPPLTILLSRFRN